MPLADRVLIPPAEVSTLAAQLDERTLHVWRLDYEPRQGRAPLRALLGAYLGLAGDSVALVEGAHGRPHLSPAQAGSLDFNWSHSGGCAVVVLGRQLTPGVDVERRRPRPRALALARRYFCPAEADWLARLPAAQREAAFLSLWTAKEAVLKALGRGLAFGLHRLEIACDTDALHLVALVGDDAHAWQLHRLELDAEHVAAVAWRGPPRTLLQWTLACTH